uniref:Uncharacterized protein n=1 Tax=Rhizophora mucronata TaxID=61149 RepID=A0A2P2MCJ6_RHIMU
MLTGPWGRWGSPDMYVYIIFLTSLACGRKRWCKMPSKSSCLTRSAQTSNSFF